MIRASVVKAVAWAILTLLYGGLATPVQGQSTGVLQATARVVDYGTSLAALEALELSVRSHYSVGEGWSFEAQAFRLDTPGLKSSIRARRPDSTVITISYLH